MDAKLNGLHTSWYENGQKESEGTYKNGTPDGKRTWWYENGQKDREATFKNGELDGKWTDWREDGQKKSEGTFKDGERISEECWDEDGHEIECWH